MTGNRHRGPQPRSVFLSLRRPDDVQKSPRFGGAKFVRNQDRSSLNHVLGRPLCVPRTSSALISRKNHLTSAQHDCAAVFRYGCLGCAIQVEEPT